MVVIPLTMSSDRGIRQQFQRHSSKYLIQFRLSCPHKPAPLEAYAAFVIAFQLPV